MKTISEKALSNSQQWILNDSARKALNEGRCIDALSLIERVPDFWSQNLITVMSVFCCHPTEDLKKWALVALKKHLAKCSSVEGLVSAALWVRNPKRSWYLPRELEQLIDDRRRAIEPDWNGVWNNPGIKGIMPQCRIEDPKEVMDPDICLDIAAQTSHWKRWLSRYLELGGDAENPKYLKIRIAKALISPREPLPQLKQMLRRYVEIGPVPGIKKFLRRIAPIRENRAGLRLNEEWSRYALLTYCSCERLEHTVEDWVHIAKSSLYLEHKMIQRIAQRGLAGLERTFSAHQVFEKLVAINGEICVTKNAKKDIGPKGNPIWQSAYYLLPVDRNAAKILISYSKYEMADL